VVKTGIDRWVTQCVVDGPFGQGLAQGVVIGKAAQIFPEIYGNFCDHDCLTAQAFKATRASLERDKRYSAGDVFDRYYLKCGTEPYGIDSDVDLFVRRIKRQRKAMELDSADSIFSGCAGYVSIRP
jgi:hypothetical protein